MRPNPALLPTHRPSPRRPPRRPARVAALSAMALVALAGCGGGADPESVDEVPTPTAEAPAGATPGATAPTPTTRSSTDQAPTASATTTSPRSHPDVVEAELTRDGDGWSVAATISSPYDSPERYADAFRVLAPDGTELGVRELLHDHAAEQPFTRSLDGIAIPDDVDEVTVEGRDLANGWGGATVTVSVPR